MVIRLLPASVILMVLASVCADDPTLHYAASDSDPEFAAVMRRLTVEDNPPEDFDIDVEQPSNARFATLRFGSFDSRRITIMLIPHDNEISLYVDVNRDRRMTERDRIEGSGPVWRIPVSAEYVVGDVIQEDRRVLRLRFARDVLSVGADGWTEGRIEYQGKKIAVRRVDADANGRFADAADLVWIDRNNDGRWEAFTERFPFRPVMRLDDSLWTCAADERGQQLSLLECTGTGTIQLQLDALQQLGLTDISVVLGSRAGSIVHLDHKSPSQSVPIGDYRPVSVVATFRRDAEPQVWRFEFVRNGEQFDELFSQVERDGTAEIHPLEEIKFGCDLNRADDRVPSGSALTATPTLTTRHGLRIQSVRNGASPVFLFTEPQARLQLFVPPNGDAVLERRCGFT